MGTGSHRAGLAGPVPALDGEEVWGATCLAHDRSFVTGDSVLAGREDGWQLCVRDCTGPAQLTTVFGT